MQFMAYAIVDPSFLRSPIMRTGPKKIAAYAVFRSLLRQAQAIGTQKPRSLSTDLWCSARTHNARKLAKHASCTHSTHCVRFVPKLTDPKFSASCTFDLHWYSYIPVYGFDLTYGPVREKRETYRKTHKLTIIRCDSFSDDEQRVL